jgi:hypothetical protein
MSSDGKPLWGFRKIFFLLGVFFGVAAVWTVVDLVNPSPRIAELNPPGSADQTFLIALVPFCALLCVGNLWHWQQLRRGHYTSRNWVIGLCLLLPTIVIIPFGILCLVIWCAKPCKSLFYTPCKTQTEQAGAANSASIRG